MTAVIPEPGDFACVSVHGAGGRLIHLVEDLDGAIWDMYQHVELYVGGGQVVEAEPGGARTRDLRAYVTPGQLTLWSTGRIHLTAAQRDAIVTAAFGYIGTPYSWLDYAAIAAHRLRLPLPGLRAYVASTHHQICSQLIDQCFADAGVHLFEDGRWPGFVTPADLAGLIEEAPA